MNKAKLTFLGTGTSQGVPIIGCKCKTCSSPHHKDKRLRSSVLVEYSGLKIIVDAGPDFRQQMLSNSISDIDAILLTHNHKDHTGGLDDIRALNYTSGKRMNIYCENTVAEHLKKEYDYIFAEKKYIGVPELKIFLIDENPFIIKNNPEESQLFWSDAKGYCIKQKDGSLTPAITETVMAEKADSSAEKHCAVIVPIRGYHDKMPVLGFRFGNIAYITDMSRIPEEEFQKLENLSHVTINTVSYRKHHSHFCLEEAIATAAKINAGNTWLTHLSHTFPPHEDFEKEIEEICKSKNIRNIIRPAHDGLCIE